MIGAQQNDAASSTILVVEEDRELAEMLCLRLEGMGLAATAVHSGEAAIAWLDGRNVPLMLLDNALPDMRTADLLSALDARNRRVAFVVIAGQRSEAIAVEMMKRGARDYLAKDGELLAQIGPTVRRVLGEIDKEQRVARLEQLLRASEHRFFAFMNNSPAVAFLKQADGRMVYINPVLERTFGLDRVDWYGKTDFELWPPEMARQLRDNDIEILRSGQPRELEERTVQSDGEHCWHVVKFPFRDATGQLFLAGMGVDVTERRRAEEALRESEKRLVKLQNQLIEAIESVSEGFALYDADDRMVICNTRFREIYDPTGDSLFTGEKFEDQLRAVVARGRFVEAQGFEEEWIRGRLSERQNPQGSRAHLLDNGHWLQVAERRTRDGGIVSTFADITDRVSAEEALRYSEERLRRVVDHMPVLLAAFDQRGSIVAWNRECERVTGYTGDQAAADPSLMERLRAESTDRRSIVQHGQPASAQRRQWETTVRDRSHVAHIVSWSNLSQDVPVQGWANWSVGVDVTERKQAEERLRRSNNLLSALNRSQSQFIAAAEMNELFDSLLRELLKLSDSQYGFIGEVLFRADKTPYLKTQAISNISWDEESRRFYERFAPDGMEFTSLQTLFGAALTSGKPVIANDAASDPRRGGLPPGHPALRAFCGMPIYFGEAFVGLAGIANRPGGYDEALVEYLQPFLTTCGSILQAKRNEISRIEAERALRDSELRFRQLAESIDQVFWFAITRPRQVLYLSPAFERIWGQKAEDVYLDVSQMDAAIHPEDRVEVAAQFAALVDGRSPTYEAEYRIVRPDGTIRWIHDQGARVLDRGPLDRISGIARDITERKRAETEARDRQSQLAHVMRLNELGKMVSELAHELNQPLYAIANYASACSETVDRTIKEPHDSISGFLRHISEQANRAGGILRRIGRFVRNEPPQRTVVALDEIVRDIAELVDIDAKRHNFRIRIATLGGSPLVRVDRVQIEQVLVNLLLNAIDASLDLSSDRCEAVVTCQCSPDLATVTVRDSGAGATDEDLKRLFEPFFTTKDNGMGMGLFISRSIIEAHGGRMGASRNSDYGMTFQFTLPLVKEGTNHES